MQQSAQGTGSLPALGRIGGDVLIPKVFAMARRLGSTQDPSTDTKARNTYGDRRPFHARPGPEHPAGRRPAEPPGDAFATRSPVSGSRGDAPCVHPPRRPATNWNDRRGSGGSVGHRICRSVLGPALAISDRAGIEFVLPNRESLAGFTFELQRVSVIAENVVADEHQTDGATAGQCGDGERVEALCAADPSALGKVASVGRILVEKDGAPAFCTGTLLNSRGASADPLSLGTDRRRTC